MCYNKYTKRNKTTREKGMAKMRTIAISDVHGCYNELKELIKTLEEEGKYNKNTDRLIFLGDYIDRGKDSRLVIKYIRELQEYNDNVIALMGNHEDMLLDYLCDRSESWVYNGHMTTLNSYDGFDKQFGDDIVWMENLPLYFEDEHFIYVHAGIDPSKPMEMQKKNTLLWVREDFIYDETECDKRVIFGHTPTMNLNGGSKPVMTYGNGNIDIDTGCVYGGALTALIINDDEIEGFYQVEKGNDYNRSNYADHDENQMKMW